MRLLVVSWPSFWEGRRQIAGARLGVSVALLPFAAAQRRADTRIPVRPF